MTSVDSTMETEFADWCRDEKFLNKRLFFSFCKRDVPIFDTRKIVFQRIFYSKQKKNRARVELYMSGKE